MLPFLLVLAFVGLLFFVGIKFSIYLYRAGSLSIRPLRYVRRVKRLQPTSVSYEIVEEPVDEEVEQEDNYVANLVRSLDE